MAEVAVEIRGLGVCLCTSIVHGEGATFPGWAVSCTYGQVWGTRKGVERHTDAFGEAKGLKIVIARKSQESESARRDTRVGVSLSRCARTGRLAERCAQVGFRRSVEVIIHKRSSLGRVISQKIFLPFILFSVTTWASSIPRSASASRLLPRDHTP